VAFITGLSNPGRIDVDDANGDLLVVEQDNQQIVRFPHDGSPAVTYGRPHGRVPGLYVATDFDGISDVAATGGGDFYVVEPYSAPRRVARFQASGSLVEEWYGGQPWASHATFDPDDPSVMWVSSARSRDQLTRYAMRINLDYAHATWSVHSTYKYFSPDNPYMHDSLNETGLFHVYKPAAASGAKYFVIEGWPTIQKIDEDHWALDPVTAVAPGSPGYQWNAGQRTNVGGTWPTTLQIPHVDANLDFYFVDTTALPYLVRRYPVDWTLGGGVPHYGSLPAGDAVATVSDRFSAFPSDARFGALLFHDVATDYLYATFNTAMADIPLFGDAFAQQWRNGQSSWAVGELGPASTTFAGNLSYQPTDPGLIYWTLRGISGVTHGCLVATDYDGGWNGEPAHTYVWDRDGLFVGGILDNPDLGGGVQPFMYQCSGEFAHSALYTAANGDVYFAGTWENDARIYKVTGWDDWVRLSGTFVVGSTDPSNTGEGLAATYFDNEVFTDPRTTRVDGPIDFNWGSAIPSGTALTSADTYSVRWLGNLRPTYGPKYTNVWVRTPDASASEGGYHQAYANGATVDVAFNGGSITVVGIKVPNGGIARFYLDGNYLTPAGPDASLDSPDGSTTVYGATLFERHDLGSGDHVLRVESVSIPGQGNRRVDIDEFIVAGGTIEDDGVPYRFYVDSDDGAQLWVDNKLEIYDWGTKSASSEASTGDIKLLRKDNPVELSYFKDAGGSASIDFQWSSPFETKQDVPARALFPTVAHPIAEQTTGATFVGVDSTTQGNWIGTYGADGNYLPSTASVPAYASATPVEDPNPTWQLSGFWLQASDHSLELPSGGRDGGTWYCGWSCPDPHGVSWEVDFSDAAWHKLSFYVLDVTGYASWLRFVVSDPVGNVLDTRDLPNDPSGTNYKNGVYLSWNVRGHVVVKVMSEPAPPNIEAAGYPTLQGFFFDPTTAVVGKAINVTGNGQSIPDGASTPDAANGTDFGQVAIDGHQDHTITIVNTGSQPVSLTAAPSLTGALAGDFVLVTQPSSPIAAGASTTFTLRFRPGNTGVCGARVTIPNDTDQSPYDFAVQGTGTP
jgi:hypothetical protein